MCPQRDATARAGPSLKRVYPLSIGKDALASETARLKFKPIPEIIENI